MGLLNNVRTDGETYDGKGDERRGIIDRIKYDDLADELVWKFPYENLSIGVQFIVNQSQEAIFNTIPHQRYHLENNNPNI